MTTLLGLRSAWSSLAPLAPDELVGADLVASFLPPLQRIAPLGLGLVGLPHWHGKRFRRDGRRIVGSNLIHREGTLIEVLPMSVALAASLADGLPAVTLTYPADARRPWRWVRDEIRRAPQGDGFVAMTFVDLPVARAAGGTPFLLDRS